MKKNILIILLSILTGLSLMFAYMQKRVAVACQVAAINAKSRADSLNLILIRETEQAQQNLERAAEVYNQSKQKTDSLK